MFKGTIYLILCLLTSSGVSQIVQLAKPYNDKLTVKSYLVSEKLDGIRAIWNGETLQTRSGKRIFTPTGFTKGWPTHWLDGELYSDVAEFEFIAATVLDTNPIVEDWQRIKFFVFDAPNYHQNFVERYSNYRTLVRLSNSKNLDYVRQYHFISNTQLTKFYHQVVEKKGEGVILHRAAALFENGRSNNIFKLKPSHDDEAIVINIIAGKGKYKHKMGSLEVQTKEGVIFKIGSGFSDLDREKPPEIGSQISYRYNGFTKNGIPRFARFLRKRRIE